MFQPSKGIENYTYSPILAISISEIQALQELPDKTKDIILPVFSLKGWATSKKLENAINKIKEAIGHRPWIADIDKAFLEKGKIKKITTGKYPREVFDEIESLLDHTEGYDQWVNFIRKTPNAVPVVQLGNRNELKLQLEKLTGLDRGIVLRFTLEHVSSSIYQTVLKTVTELHIDNIFVIYDYEQISKDFLKYASRVSEIVKETNKLIPTALISLSCSSFPSNFANRHASENSIYERQLFDKVAKQCEGIRMIYSDRGSARAKKIYGGGGVPSPRIDYPLKKEWKFIRKEFENSKAIAPNEREKLYTAAAKEIISEEYWDKNLQAWGQQYIELTSKGDLHGINSATKSTAARLNIHLLQQAYYDTPSSDIDTDEDWED